ncbi:MAG TPA: Ig-like domain-containing protein [Candidatus Limnocylindria bacterium]|nr:Ig-like domain-containing protein [Candidatus Limnocylindria bacterium]
MLALLGVPVALAVIHSAADDEYPAREDTQLSVPTAELLGVLDNDIPESDTCVDLASVDATALQGTLNIQADGSFEFLPAPNFHGATTFKYKMGIDQGGGCPEGEPSNDATVTITVSSVNDPPTVVLDSVCWGDVIVAEDSGAFADPGHCVEMSDFGPLDDAGLSFDEWVVSSTNPGLFSSEASITAVDGTFGRLHFTPATNANGTATVTVRGRDGGGTADGGADLSDPVQFNITVTPVNDAPTAVADSFFALADRTLNVGAPGVLINDGDIDSGSISAVKVSNPAHGVVTLAADGSFSYMPQTGYEGPDAFSYRASDGSLFSPTRVVSLTVSTVPPINTPTPFPSVAPTAAPTPEPTIAEPSASAEPPPSLEPGASPAPTAQPAPSPSLEPGVTPAPDPSTGEGGGLSLPVLLVIVLFVLLLAFGAAVYVPKWFAQQRGGPPDTG